MSQTYASAGAATGQRTAPEPLYGGAGTGRRGTVRDIAAAKARGEKWPMLTAYAALTAGIFDRAGIPVLLVGDSASMVVYGHESTIPVTVDELIPLTAAVVRGTSRAMGVSAPAVGSLPGLAGRGAGGRDPLPEGERGAGGQAGRRRAGRPPGRGPGRGGRPGDGPPRPDPPVGQRPGRLPGAGPRRGRAAPAARRQDTGGGGRGG